MILLSELTENDYYNGYLELLEQLTEVNKDQISYEKFRDIINANKSIIIVAKLLSGKIIGTGTIFIEQKIIHSLGKVGHIEDIVIDKEYRKNGIGKLIIGKLINIANAHKCYKVILDCSEQVKQFYEKQGFNQKGFMMALYL